MQKNYLFFDTTPKQILYNMIQKLHFDENCFFKRNFIQRVLGISLLLLTSFSYGQLATEYFESGIPGAWSVKSNLATPPINNNWTSSAAGTGYGGGTTKAASINPALNVTTGTTAEYYMITPLFNTPTNGEIRFYTKQGSVTNRGTTYQVKISTASQPDISSFNVVLGSWTEPQLNVSATTYEEKVVTIPSGIPSGIPVYIAFVAVTNQTGVTSTSGDTWFVDNVRVIPGCTPVTGITSIPNSDSAVINWTHSFATEFGIEVVPQGAGHGSLGTTVTSPTYTATGLLSNTTYDVWIQVHCDATTTSTWAGPFQITTSAVGFSCAAPIIIPPSASSSTYTLATNLNTFYDNVNYINYDSTGSTCLPSNATTTWNYLSGDHAFLSFTPATTGLINITQAVSTTSGGGCYGNTNSSVLIYDSCANVGTPNCLGAVITSSSPGIYTSSLNNFYVLAGHTYFIVISSPYQHSATSAGASICFTFTLSGSTCSAPSATAMSYKHLLDTSATFSWDNAMSLMSQWQYVALPLPGTGIPAPPTGSETLLTTSTNIDNGLTGLNPDTSYNLYVRSVCGGTPGPWSMPFPFRTQCTIFPTPYSTAFTGASTAAPEPCWTSLDLNGDTVKFIYSNDSSPGAPQGQIARLYTSNSGNNTNDMLITPRVHFDGVTQKRLRYKFKGFGGYTNINGYVLGESSYTIKISATGIGEQDFTTTIDPLQTYETGNNWVERIIPIPIGIVGNVNISWHLPQGSLQTATNLTIDDVYIEDLPACSDPMYPSIVAGSITSTSAQLSWTNGYNTSQWEIIAQPMGTAMPSASASGTIVSTNPYTFTGLTPSTQYDFWIRSYCDATHQSNWVGPVSFYTTCIAQPTPYYESFNDGDITSKKFCWTIQNRNSDTAKWSITTTEARIAPQNIDYFTPLVNFDDWLVSVPLNIVGQKRLRFKYKAQTDLFYPTPRADMEVVISSDPTFATYTVLIPEHEFTNNNYMEDSVLFTGTGVSYIAFRIPPTMVNPVNSAYVLIDDVYVEDPPGCEVPSNLTATGMTTTSANLSWAVGYTETQWEVKVQSPMSGVPTGSGTIVNSTPAYTATGLSVDTPYEYYVRAICDATHSSNWVGPFKFRTICNAIPTPFTETFDTTSTTETCWTIYNNNGDSHVWNTNETGTSPIGDQMAAFMSGTNGANNDWLITPTLIAHPNQRLRFKYKTYSANFEEDLKVMLSTNGVTPSQFSTVLYENNLLTTTDATGTVTGSNTITLASAQDVRLGDVIYIPNWPFDYGTTVTAINGLTLTLSTSATSTLTGAQNITITHETINNPVFREKVINLPSGLTGNINIGFYVPFFPPNPWNYRGQFLFIDNVIIEDIPACSSVSNVTASNIVDTSADINWTVNGTETSWEISVQPYGTAAPVGATLPAYLVTTSTHPKTITGLTPSSHYQYYIRSICSGSSQSEWVGPFDLLTKCDYSNVCQYTISVSNGSTGHVYQGLELRQNGATIQMLTFPQTGASQPTVIDYQVFLCRGVEFSLYFNAGGGYGTQYSQAQAVVKDENNTVVWTSPLGLGTPYTNVYTGVSTCGTVTCAQPTNVIVSNQDIVSWTPGGTETQWEVSVKPYGSGVIPQSGTIVNSPSYTLVASDFANAAAGTYEVFVRAICGSSSKSFWTGPKVFVRNDESNTAVHLPVNTGATCDNSGIDASFIGSTVSTNVTTCTTENIGDIWYDFVASSKVHIIELSDFAPGSYYTGVDSPTWPKITMALYEVQTDGSLLQKSCSENNSFVTMYTSELVVGHTYKIRVILNSTVVPNNKTFHICITTPSDACTMNAFNYDFEKLAMQGVTGVSSIIDSRVIPGWRESTDWGGMFFQEGSNSPGIVPYSGGQCLQLIQDNASTWNASSPIIKGLYKDFDTSEIVQMDYSFASATRANYSTLQLYAGPPSGPFTLVAEHTANSLVWQLVQGNYMVPVGQTTTRFTFRVKNYTIGHLLDTANFKPNTDIITANATLPCATTSMLLEAQGVGQWVADVSNPATVIIATPNVKSTIISGFNTPGTYIFHWKTRYCDKTITIIYQGISELPVVTNPTNYCKNATALPLAASVTATYSPIWYTVPVGGVGSTTAPTPSTSVVGSSQVYYVSATDGSGCEGPRSQIVVQVNDLPTITGTLSACIGNTTQLTGSATAATTNAWTSSNTSVATVSNTGLVTGVSAGTSTITYTNDKGCQVSVNLTINALPTITGTLSACIGNTTQLTGSATAATTNAWISSNTSVATISATGLVTGVSTGTSIITYTNSNGCQVTTTVTIGTSPTITGTLSVCVGLTTQLNGSGTAATTNAWGSSNTAVATISATGLVTGVSVGTTTITYTNNSGCIITATVSISSQITPTFNSIVACQNATVVFPSQSLENITGTWSPSTINNSSVGTTTYTFMPNTAIPSQACAINGSLSVTINALPTITGTLSACVGNTNQLTGSATAATTNAWTSSNTAVATISATGLVTGVSAGTSIITYTNSNGCQVTATVTINALPTITGTLSACVGNTTQLTGSATAATTNAWTSSNTAVATISATGLVTGVSVGTSTITYTNSNGCQVTVTVTINGLPTITGTLSACVGNTTQLTGSETAATTNAWTSSNTVVATISATGLVTGVSVGTSTITYTNSNGCQVTVTVTINGLPTITGTLSACVGNTTQLTGSATAATTNAWTSSNTAVATISATGLVTGVSVGTSTITYTNSNGCQITATVTINGLPTITGTLSACIGNTTQLTGSATEATTNAWTSSTTAVATISATGLVTGVSAGTSTITYTNSNGCQITATVTINGLPTITGTLSACIGNTTQLTGSATAATTNAWTSSNTAVATISATGLVTGVSAGTSTITYTNSNGCQVAATFTINGLPTITGTLSACVGNTTQLTGSATAATTNAWTSSNTAVATISATGLVTGVSVGTSTITYTNNNGCLVTAIVTVSSQITTSFLPIVVCQNAVVSLPTQSQEGITGTWLPNTIDTATVGTTSYAFTPDTSIPSQSCAIAGSLSITINALPTITGTLSACVGNTTQLTGSVTAATANAWTSSNTAVATISNIGLVTGVSAGTSTITYTNSNGCLVTATVTINALPTITGTLSACIGNTTQLTGSATAATTNAWTSSNTAVALVSTTGLVTGVSVGTSTITYTNSNGCQVTATVTINGLPTMTGTLSACIGNITQLTGSATAATTNAWTSSNTAVAAISATGLVTGVSAGTSTITYTNNNGCQVTATVTINGLPTITGTLSACVGNTTQLTGSAITATTNAWTSSTTAVATISSTGLVTGVSAGTSIITYTNSNGCQTSATVTVNALATPNVTFSYAQACINASANPLPILPTNFTSGGVFSSTTLTVNATTGSVNLASATTGSHQIIYTLSQNLGTCTAAGTYTATIVISAGITPVTSFTYDSNYCANSGNALPTIATGFYTGGVFSSTNGLVINGSTGEINIAQSTPGSYSIVYTVLPNASNCNNGGTSNFSIVISQGLDYTIEDVCQAQMLELHVTPSSGSFTGVNYVWRNQSNIIVGTNSSLFNVDQYMTLNPSLSLPQIFTVSVELNGCTYTSSFTVQNNPCKMIPRGISPNNDQVNDTFDLIGLGVTELNIFNRYGSKVYSFNGNYTNQWSGLSDGGSELPDGTYFYSIIKGDGSNVTGWVYINRQY
jgi:gliding motility-associated-like protein